MYDTIPSKYLSLILADFSHVKTLSIRFDRKANICCAPAHSVKTTFNSYSLSWRHENSYSNTWKQLKQMTYFFPIWKIFISNKMEINSFYQCLCKLTREKKNINNLYPWKTHTHRWWIHAWIIRNKSSPIRTNFQYFDQIHWYIDDFTSPHLLQTNRIHFRNETNMLLAKPNHPAFYQVIICHSNAIILSLLLLMFEFAHLKIIKSFQERCSACSFAMKCVFVAFDNIQKCEIFSFPQF